ncbi:MAG: thiamine pyrophosphate-binding protein [Solirubrobacteraceae bacterium]
MAKRIGGHLVAESLTALGAEAGFGVPGIHALAIWEGLRDGGARAPLHVYGTRTELAAGFAADGYARSSGRPAPLFLSTGPGALNSLTALMEAASSHVPVVAVSSQIPSHLIGRGRGYLHELTDQLASFAPIVKDAVRAHSVESIPGLLARAWRIALTPPSGPVYLEIPVDLLTAPAPGGPVTTLEAMVERECAPLEHVLSAATRLAHAKRPVIWAGGGVVRSGARTELRELAELLQAPVATTYMGKGAFPGDHPLAAGSGCDEAALQELLADGDVVLCVGTELGAETTGQYGLRFGGQVIHLDAAPERIGVNSRAQPLVGDAKLTLLALVAELSQDHPHPPPAADVPERVAALRDRIHSGLEAQGRETELGLLQTIESGLPADAVTVWDMTILSYWAAPHLRLGAGQQFLYPMGSGTLGYAWPAAIGAAVAHPERPVLGVIGDGGLQYTLAELGTAAQHEIAAKLLVVDDGGYGILREYQSQQFGHTTSVELPDKNIEAMADAFSVPVRTATPENLAELLEWAFARRGPAVVVLRQRLAAAQPTS